MQKNISFTNGQKLESRRQSFSPRVSASFNFKELVEIEPEYSISYGVAKYNLSQLENVKYTSQNAGLKTTTYWPKHVIWGNDINYSYNNNVGVGFDKDAVFWNMSLGVQLFKEKATLKVLAYDLLNQQINTRRSTGDDYIQDVQGTVLQQYFMLSFTYKFDQFGGAKKKGRGVRFM